MGHVNTSEHRHLALNRPMGPDMFGTEPGQGDGRAQPGISNHQVAGLHPPSAIGNNEQHHGRQNNTQTVDHAKYFPSWRENIRNFDPSQPLRLNASKEPQLDLTGATPANLGDDPTHLRNLFSATVGAYQSDTQKGKEKSSDHGEIGIREPKRQATVTEMNDEYRQKIGRSSSPASKVPRKMAMNKSKGVAEGRVTKSQATKSKAVTRNGPGSSRAAQKSSRNTIRDAPAKLEPQAKKAIDYAFHLGSLWGNKTHGSAADKGTIPPEEIEKLKAQVPEFFSGRTEDSTAMSSEPRSGFTPSPQVSPDPSTPSRESNGGSKMPNINGAGSGQRIPNAMAIQGQMAKAMNGHGQVRSRPTRVPGEGNGCPGSFSPFRVNGNRAQFEQQRLCAQTKATGTEMPAPRRSHKRAASKSSLSEEQELRGSTKRRKTCQEEAIAPALTSPVEEAPVASSSIEEPPEVGQPEISVLTDTPGPASNSRSVHGAAASRAVQSKESESQGGPSSQAALSHEVFSDTSTFEGLNWKTDLSRSQAGGADDNLVRIDALWEGVKSQLCTEEQSSEVALDYRARSADTLLRMIELADTAEFVVRLGSRCLMSAAAKHADTARSSEAERDQENGGTGTTKPTSIIDEDAKLEFRRAIVWLDNVLGLAQGENVSRPTG